VLMLMLLGDKGAQVVSEVEDWVAGVKGLRGILETEGFLRLRDIRRVSSHVFLDPSSHVSSPDPSERHPIQGFPSVNLLLWHLLVPIRAALIVDVTQIVLLLLLLLKRSLLALSMGVWLGQRGWVSYRILGRGFDVDVHQLGLGAILDILGLELPFRSLYFVRHLQVLNEPDLRLWQGPQPFFLPGTAARSDLG